MTITALPTPARWSAVRPLRWGILAPGSIAGSFVEAVHKRTSQRVVAVGSRSLDRARAFTEMHGISRGYGNYEELVHDAEVDAVYVASPHNAHAELALLAIAAGKHVLVEKPIATTAAEARRIFDAAEAAGVFAMEAMWTRYLPQSGIIRRLVSDGILGDISSVSADFGFAMPYQPEHRLFDPAQAGGALFDGGVYPVSFISSILGAPSELTAIGTLAPSGVDDSALVSFTYPEATASAAASLRGWTPTTASIAGNRGRLDVAGEFFRPGSLRLTLIDFTTGVTVLDWRDEEYGDSRTDGLSCQVDAFAQFVIEGRTESPIHPHEEAVAIIDALDAAQKQIFARAEAVRREE